jgi:predicted Zn finger-like uncharacterized protein
VRLICEACGSRYRIADERVRGKIVKIQCRKCATVLEAHLPAEAPSASSSSSKKKPPPKPPRPPPLPEKEWFVAAGGNIAGPVSLAELKLAMRNGELGPDDLIWRAGLETWQPIAMVSQVGGLISEPTPARWPLWLLAAGGVTLMVATTVVLVLRTGQQLPSTTNANQLQRCPPPHAPQPIAVPLPGQQQPLPGQQQRPDRSARRVVLENPPPIKASKPRPEAARRPRVGSPSRRLQEGGSSPRPHDGGPLRRPQDASQPDSTYLSGID